MLKDVSFLGAVDDCEKVKLFAKSWALGVTSITEGWGLVITEAAACGTPTISYDTGASGESLINDHSGILVSNGDVEGFAKTITMMMLDEKLRDLLSRGALDYSRKFDWESTTDATLKILTHASDGA